MDARYRGGRAFTRYAREEQSPETIQIFKPDELEAWAVGAADDDPAQFLIIDIVSLVKRIWAAAAQVCEIYDFEFNGAFQALGVSAFGTESEQDWTFKPLTKQIGQ